jgi:hypothetical protein
MGHRLHNESVRICRRLRDRAQASIDVGGPTRAVGGRDETGAVLLLALMFLVAVGLIVGGIAAWTANDLDNSLVFAQARSADFSLNSATQLAVQSIRYTPLIGSNETLNASPPSYCWGSGPTSGLTTQGDAIDVWCSTVWNPTSSSTRVVTISACLTSITPTAAGCASTPGLQTVVTFDDYASSLSPPNPGQCTNTCGSGMTINSATMPATSPAVTGLSSTAGSVTGGTGLTVTGTGFVNGSTTVQFVATSPADPNLVLQGTNVNVASGTSLSLTIPASTTSTTFYVVVTTPEGMSSDGTPTTYQPIYTYQPLATPTATAICLTSAATTAGVCPTGSTPSGSASGGTAFTIDGTGFMSSAFGDGTTVDFTDTANPAIVVAVTNEPNPPAGEIQALSVNSTGTVITATTPPITQGTNFSVTVTTTPGGSTQSSSLPQFTFGPYYPVAAGITPTGGTNQSVTVIGLGFLSGGTVVTLIPAVGTAGGSVTLTGVAVSSSTSLTGLVPSTGGTAGGVYYVSVTTTWNGTQYQSCNASANGNVPACSAEGAPQYTY